jgi:hypothetical protein
MDHIGKLDLTDRANVSKTRSVLRKPFAKMKSDAKKNLKSQGSVFTGNLERGLGVGSKVSKAKGYMSVAFGGRAKTVKNPDGSKKKAMNHFHLVNSGTKYRNTLRPTRYTGAVGRSKTDYEGKNKSFRIGFADKAIKSHINSIEGIYIDGFNKILQAIRTNGV